MAGPLFQQLKSEERFWLTKDHASFDDVMPTLQADVHEALDGFVPFGRLASGDFLAMVDMCVNLIKGLWAPSGTSHPSAPVIILS